MAILKTPTDNIFSISLVSDDVTGDVINDVTSDVTTCPSHCDNLPHL